MYMRHTVDRMELWNAMLVGSHRASPLALHEKYLWNNFIQMRDPLPPPITGPIEIYSNIGGLLWTH